MKTAKAFRRAIKPWILLLVLPILFLGGCSHSPNAADLPRSLDEVKAAVIDAGMDLSYLESSELLDEMQAEFSYDCKGALLAYVTGSDPCTKEEQIWILNFEYASDAAKTERVISGKLPASSDCGSSGTLVWYGRAEVVKVFLDSVVRVHEK